MAFFKFRRGGPRGTEGRGAAAAVPAGRGAIAAAPAESIEAMRRRARHRLLGAAVLLLIGVIGFPLLFDTQPRPISVDIPIEIPDRNKVKPLALPTPPAATTSSAAPGGKGGAPAAGTGTSATASANSGQGDDGIITEAADGTEIHPGKAGAQTAADGKSDAADSRVAAVKPDAKAEMKAPDGKPKVDAKAAEVKAAEAKTASAKADAKAAASARTADDGDRARALLEGKPVNVASAAPAAAASSAATPAATDNGRFVVQVGAFADADKAKDVRQKLEKAGLKTYTNVAKTADGERTRVRVGPFATRADADRAASKVKGLSLPAAVLSL